MFTSKNLLLIALMALLLIGVTNYYSRQLHSAQETIHSEITTHVQVLAQLADVTDRDQSTSVVAEIITDCNLADREQFDSLLNRLADLNQVELLTLEQLFKTCGYYYSTQKAVMVTLMAEKLISLEVLVMVGRQLFGSTDYWSDELKIWHEIITLEQDRSRLLTELVAVQYEIITLLQTGLTAQSDEIENLRISANEARETLSLKGVQIDTLRSTLSEL